MRIHLKRIFKHSYGKQNNVQLLFEHLVITFYELNIAFDMAAVDVKIGYQSALLSFQVQYGLSFPISPSDML